MRICPPAGSIIRNRPNVRDDLPAPVRPTIPTCKEKKKAKLKVLRFLHFCRIWGSHSGGYRKFHLLGYNAMQSVANRLMVWKNMLPLKRQSIFSGLNSVMSLRPRLLLHNLSLEADYNDWDMLWFSSILPGRCKDSISYQAVTTSFYMLCPLHTSIIIVLFDAI
jgi:hypothetical protein